MFQMDLRTFAVAAAVNLVTLSAAFPLDTKLPAYQTAAGISGRLKSVGSDTLGNETAVWAKAFMDRYPDVKIEIEAKGSATAPSALLEGASQFAPMSRPMTTEEVAAFEMKYGYKAASFRVAIDALSIYVNKDNHIPCLTMPQLSRIFSSSRKVPGGNDIKTWGDVGLTGEWAAKPIVMYGRNSISGTYEFFQQMVLYSGDYKQEVRQQPSSEAVVEKVAGDKFAIGYSGLGFKTDGVRTVPLASYASAQCYDTSAEATYSGKYPIARYLYIYLNKKPDQQLDPLRREFIKYILSKDGQTQTEIGGFYPITSDIREQDLRRLGIPDPAN
jgi:phosphate transport system substrate-binding protein